MGHENEYYWCLRHHRVELYEECKRADRLGPYATREEAEQALAIVSERNDAWENDPRYHDDTDDSDGEDAADDDQGWGPFRF